MEWLRWILLAIGIVLIGAVYVSSRGWLRWRDRKQSSGLDFSDDLGGDWVGKPRVVRSADDAPETDDTTATGPANAGSTEQARPVRDADEPSDFLTQSDFDFSVSREPVGTPPVEEDLGTAEPEPARAETEAPPAASEPEPPPVSRPPPEPEPAPEPYPEPGPESEPKPEPEPAPARAESSQRAAPERAAEPEPEDEHMVVLYLAAAEGERLVGAQLAVAFARHGLEHGELGIFHARAGGDGSAERPEPATDFSIANAVEPGSFDPATMDTLSTPGVVLFMRVPGPSSPINAFDRMVATARSLGEELGARVLDEKKIPLTRQEEQHLRDQLRQAIPALQRARSSDRSRR